MRHSCLIIAWCIVLALDSIIWSAPTIVTLTHPIGDVPIVLYDVTQSPYSADLSGANDATAAIQKALNDCGAAGGGVVFLPNGEYRIDSVLTIPNGVTMRGDWKQPGGTDSSAQGTTLLFYHGKGSTDSIGTISLGNGSAVKCLNIFYPEQSAASPTAYPPAVSAGGNTQTVWNVTFVNAYQAMVFAQDAYSVGQPLVKNVYGAPLLCGVLVDHVAAVPRIEGVHFHPSFWSKSGLSGAPSASAVRNCMRALGGKGIRLANSANFIVDDVDLDGYDVGIEFNDLGQGSSNGKAYDIAIAHTRIGINILSQNVQGWSFTHGSIGSDDAAGSCVNVNSGVPVFFNDFAFTSKNVIARLQDGAVSLVRCRMTAWGDTAAVVGVAGNLQVSGCTFGAPTALGTHFDLGPGLTGITIFGNTFAGSSRITNHSCVQTPVIDTTTSYQFADFGLQPYQSPARPLPARTSSGSLYNVVTYGASGNGVFDNTAAFQSALNAAGTAGGGTVFVPAGAYRINGSLTVPQGVELRGVNDAQFYTNYAGSALLTYTGKNDSSATPFITLKGQCGVNGLLIFRPEQPYNETKGQTTIFAYPPAVYADGSGCWAIDLVISNAYIGVDFSKPGAGGHYIDFYFSAPLDKCLLIRGDGARSTVQNMQTNPNFFRTITRVDWTAFMSKALCDSFKGVAPLVAQSQNCWPRGTAVEVYGDGQLQVYSSFYNSPFKGVVINGAPTMTTLLSGGEGDNFYEVNKSSGVIDLTIIGNSYHPIGANGSYGKYNLSSSSDRVRILDAISFGGPSVAYAVDHGSLLIQQAYQVTAIPTFVAATGGAVVTVEGAYLRSPITTVVNAGDTSRAIIAGCISGAGYAKTGNVSVIGSSTDGSSCSAGTVPPSKGRTPASVRIRPGKGAIALRWDGSSQIVVDIMQVNGKLVDRLRLAPHSLTNCKLPYRGVFLVREPLGVRKLIRSGE